MIIKKLIIAGLMLLLLSSLVWAASPAVRIKDISHILEARDNQLMGFGLVVGLSRSGDSRQTAFTDQALTNLLSRMGVVPQTVDFRSRNTAAVMVTANLPPFVKPGQKIDVTISSVGDSTSLRGGTLLLTPLQGVDEEIYAVAQGTLSLGSLGDDPTIPPLRRAETNVGYIPGGAMVEKEVPVSLGSKELLTIVLNEPDFTTAVRVADSIKAIGMTSAAKDAATVTVQFTEVEDAVALISRIENLTVVPDTVAKVVINERTGTIVMGENVRIAPVAVAYSGMNIIVGDIKVYAEATTSNAEEQQGDLLSTQSGVKVRKINAPLTVIPATASLSDLVNALNAVRARPKDLIVILQALKKVGALNAQIEVI